MRFIAVVMGTLFILFGATYWVVFTESGNKILIPYMESKASEVLKAPVNILVFRLTPSSLALDATYQESLHVKAEGDLSIFSKSFNIDYLIEAENIKTEQIAINEPISLKGNAKGDLKDINIKGVGVVFEAPASYDVRLVNNALSRAIATVENISIQKLLGVANQPIIAHGRGDLHVNITDDAGTPSGDAKIQIFEGMLDEKVIFEKYGVSLPPKVLYQANIDAKLQGTQVQANGVVDSSLARFLIESGLFDTKSRSWKSDFELFVPSLSAINTLAGMPLQGKMLVVGEASGDKREAQARAKTESLGGKIEAIYQGDNAYVNGENVDLEKILHTLVQPPLANGKMNFEFKMDSIANKKGAADLHISQGAILGSSMKELSGLDWPKSTSFGFKASADINDKKIGYDASVESELASVLDIKGEFDTVEVSTQAPFSLHVKELANLAFATGRTLHGSMQANGILRLENGIPYLQASTDVLGGQSVVTYENTTATLNAKNFSMQRLSEVVDFPHVLEATGEASARYDVALKQGEFSLLLPEGHLRQSELVGLVRALTGFDLVQETYTDSTVKGVVKDQMVGFDVSMLGKESFLRVEQGVLNLDKQTINAPFALKVQNKDLSGAIKGKMNEPKVSVRASEYIKKKIGKELEKHIPKEAGETVKELMKLF
jgi:hypothetical protein